MSAQENGLPAGERIVCSMESLQVTYSETLQSITPKLDEMTEQDVDELSDEAVLALLAQGEDGDVSAIVKDLSMIEGMLDNMEGTSNALEGKLHELLREFQGLRESVAAAAGDDDDEEEGEGGASAEVEGAPAPQ